ncbi:lymphokine-activated killer T-cell-originated protein kinase isoform X2 [Rhinatrema bivittatum]|uniref:lymphokine-activated killer T-cell-originated protein kinase-like isoform X2 n=1 Tax=Rhinatrema bivittatum TaxID=194408 RepID=UPI00112B6735|nr:lymphokine-activated killer T-cell-originated protein kinase-like isoform X2 [Rhinatrema bivittatum]XP_029452087.1 lymphokine-activated killer T-cell-originated protein kinase isoform X2 [Rhinatrema bivittatum]
MDGAKGFKTPCKQDERRKSVKTVLGTPTSVVIPASPFMKKLGYGTGVSVYLMKRSPRGSSENSQSPWAVKKINAKLNNIHQSIYQQRLNEEASILKNLQHPNIVGYRAFTKAKDGSMCLAMEYGGDKSLNDLIEFKNEKGEGPFPATTIWKVALHMARGLKYLHNEKKLLHGDIKSSNVVIKGDFETIKICDVGVSLPLDENMMVSDTTLHYIGTEPWKPKEALEDGGIITDKSDIFAFGLTLWEMMTLAIPHVNLPDEDDGQGRSLQRSWRFGAYQRG